MPYETYSLTEAGGYGRLALVTWSDFAEVVKAHLRLGHPITIEIDEWGNATISAALDDRPPVQSLDSATTRVQERAENEIRSGCPCAIITPCSTACTCANGVMSGGCSRCARYGGPEQRTAAAERIAAALDRAGSPQGGQGDA